METFFYVKDVRHEHRLFTADPPVIEGLKRTKAQQAWELAKKKLLLLPQRTLRQEQAFAKALRIEDPIVRIRHGDSEAKHISAGLRFFLYRQRSKRLVLLILESLLVPLTALLMPLPGPNVAFYAVALLIITHWQSFRGIRAFLKKDFEFAESPLLAEWEAAVKAGDETAYAPLLARMEAEMGVQNLRKILWT